MPLFSVVMPDNVNTHEAGRWTSLTGVLRYVCLGGSRGKLDEICRSVAGMVGTVPSSSEGSSSGERGRGGGRSNEVSIDESTHGLSL